MSHTYVSDLVHCVLSTKQRKKLIPATKQAELWSFIGGIAPKNGFKALIVGGTEDHVHILLSLPAAMPLAKAVQLLKVSSSRWMNETHAKGFSGRRATARLRSGSRRSHARLITSSGRQSIIANAALRKSLLRS